MVAAVPMVMQVPGERAIESSISCQSPCVMRPARSSSQYFHVSDPEPSVWSRQWPLQHRPRGQVDRRQIHAGRAHDERGRGLVATAHQHRAVDGVGAQQLLGLHGEEIAVQHRGRLLHGLGERHGRHLQRETARLPHAALHLLGALPEMRMAVVDVRPGIDDRDHRLARVVGAVVAHLRRARAMAERAQVLDAEPAVANEVPRGVFSWRDCIYLRAGGDMAKKRSEPRVVRPDDIDPHHDWKRPLQAPGHHAGRFRGARRFPPPARLPPRAHARGAGATPGLGAMLSLRPAQHPLHHQHRDRRVGARQADALLPAHRQRRALHLGFRLGGAPPQAVLRPGCTHDHCRAGHARACAARSAPT